MIDDARLAHARAHAWSRMPSERMLRRRAEVPEGTKEPPALAAMLGPLVREVWDEHTTDIVDIFLSAGPREGYGTSEHRTCGHLNTMNCSLHHLRFSLKRKRVLGWRVVAAADPASMFCGLEAGQRWLGYTEPALSPTTGRLVATARCHDAAAEAESADIRVWEAPDAFVDIVYRGSGTAVPQYGNFLSDDLMMYNTRGDGGKVVWYAGVWPDFANPPARALGPGFGGDKSFQDPNVSHNAVDAAEREARIVTFGGTGDERIPRVVGAFAEREHAFDLPQTIDGSVFSECHHPAWRPDGHQILCTRIQLAETMDATYNVSRLYGFTYDGVSSWTDPTALVEYLSPEDFNSIFVDASGNVIGLFPPSEGLPTPGTCAGYVWKYAEWCGSERYLIATVFCTDADPSVAAFQAIASRVVLIDLDADTSTTAAYTDLTAYVESRMHAPAGSYDAVFATCGAVPDVEEL